MALKNRLGTGVFHWEGENIKLQSSLSNLEALAAATGKDAIEVLQSASTPADLATMFYHLQLGSEYSRDEIYAAFFGRMGDFEKTEWQEALTNCISDMLGVEKMALIQPASPDAPKNPPA
jgi:hypothetical protein